MARTLPVDLDWARHGYLLLPNGRCRHIIGLDVLTRDIVAASVSLSWADLPGKHPAFCHVASRSILLAPWLFWAYPAYFRAVVSEELGHCVVGHSEDAARQWAARRYGALLVA